MKQTKYKSLLIIAVVGLLAWIFYSFTFFKTYSEATIFATDGAQPIIQILEILNYRGKELLPFFILFFLLTSLSFLFEFYLFLYANKFKLSQSPVKFLGGILLVFISINLLNKLFLLLITLVSVSIVVVLAIAITVHYLYVDNNEDYDEASYVRGPFKTLEKAEVYRDNKVTKFNKKNKESKFELFSIIDLEFGEGYYINFYLKDTNNRGNQHGGNNDKTKND